MLDESPRSAVSTGVSNYAGTDLPNKARAATVSEIFVPEPVSVHDGVACFVKGSSYTDNFGKQWQRFRDTQLDSRNGTTISRDYMTLLLGQPLGWLEGKTVLEIGAGAGRFTEHFVRYADLVVAVDFSEAIYANVALGCPNFVAARADMLAMPPFKIKFDVVFCRGVLQHTPDPVRAIAVLHDWAKPDGMIVFDYYLRPTLGPLCAKYLWRPVVQHFFTYESFSEFLDRNAERALATRWAVTSAMPGSMRRWANAALDYMFPIADYKGRLPLDDRQLVEWAKLDTMDAMFPAFDNPKSFSEIMGILKSIGAEIVWADPRNYFRTRPGH